MKNNEDILKELDFLRKQNEALLKENKQLSYSEEKLKIIFEYAPEAYYINDLKGNFIDGNKKAEELIGYKKEELINKNFMKLNLLPASQILKAAKLLVQNALGRPTGPDELLLQRKDGARVYLEISTFPVKIAGNKLILGIARDMTRNKQLENEKRDLQEKLDHSLRMDAIGRLAGGIAHDFNNLLSVILGYADLIRYKYKDNEKLLELIYPVIDAASRASDLTGSLLTFSRKNITVTAIVDFHVILKNLSEILKRTINKNIELELNLNASHHRINGDENQLNTSIMNILLNAAEAISDGGKIIIFSENIALDRESAINYGVQEGSFIMVSVTDTGKGMDTETKEKVFEPFFSTRENGTGLGLTNAYGLVKSSGGFIDISSEAGKGTTVQFALPVTNDEAADRDNEQPVQAGGMKRIMMVDDEELIRGMYSESLKEFGFQVTDFGNGYEALEYYRENYKETDLVILDMVMPKMDGAECFAEIIKINPQANVIVASGYSLNSKIAEVLKNGARAFLQKPFDLRELTETINKFLKPGH